MSARDKAHETVRAQLLTGAADCFEFRLRPHFRVQVVIPRDFTKSEAQRLSRFIESLVVPSAQPATEG